MTPYKQTYNKIPVLFITSLVITAHTLSANWFDIDDLFVSMEQQMQQIRQEMEKMQNSMQTVATQQCKNTVKKSIKAKITEDSSKNGIIVTISNIQAESIDAQVDEHQNTLHVVTPHATIKLASRNTAIGLDIDETIKQEQADEKKGAVCSFFAAQSHAYSKQQLSKPIDIQKAKIDYNPENQELIISIAYTDNEKSMNKKLPISIIKSVDTKETPKEK